MSCSETSNLSNKIKTIEDGWIHVICVHRGLNVKGICINRFSQLICATLSQVVEGHVHILLYVYIVYLDLQHML